MKPENKQTKVESKPNGGKTPLIFIGGVLLLAVLGGWWLYNNSKTNTAATTGANKTPAASNNQNLYANAKPGANPPWSKGAPNAAVTIEEFADFQCPTCAQMHPRVNELRAAYGDRVRIIFRQFPLNIPAHDKAYDAAVATEAAGMQGKFWDMQNILFANQQTWSRAADFRTILNDYAQKIGLDVQKFNNDMAGMQAKLRVNADLERGRSINVNSTPSFYINGRLAESLDMSYLRQVIDAELQKAGK